VFPGAPLGGPKEAIVSDRLNRRKFLGNSATILGAGALAMSLEEKALLAQMADKPAAKPPEPAGSGLPQGQIGDVKISRIICGGNLIGGYAHSRDLIYVSSLLKHYFTDDKILETLEVCEENGINTIITGSSSAAILNRYWNERGGKIQWISQIVPAEDDLATDVKKSIDGGAVGAFLIGNAGDLWSREGKIDRIGKVLENIRKQGVIAGVGGHELRTPMACEEGGLAPDFYMKTFHSTNYWSTRQPGQDKEVIDNYDADNYWARDPDKTIAFMSTLPRPWIAYKVLAAGAIHPSDGFRHAFENGADFCCVGMFDFQVVEDALIAKKLLADASLQRSRPWRG